MTTSRDRRRVQDEFLTTYTRDLEARAVRTLEEYQRLFPGHDDCIAEQWAWLEPQSVSGHSTMPEAAAAAPVSPTRIGPYRVLEQLGRGAQATVHLAEHETLGRRVALKVLHTSILGQDDTARSRFEREASLTAGLDHPGICSVFEAGEQDGLSWIAMRYVPGDSLAAHRARWAEARARQRTEGEDPSDPCVPLPDAASGSDPYGASSSGGWRSSRAAWARVVRLVEHTARAVHVAHEAGLVHRDLKPGNIMVTPEGRPVVLDFGLARAELDGLDLTRSADLLGTPYTMAPEQLRSGGRAARVDRRTDVWALGITLYECLAGTRPFDGASRDALYRSILEAEPAPLRAHNPRIPRDVETVVSTALEKDPARRYDTALDLAEDLRRVLSREPIVARRVSAIERGWRWCQRHPAVAVSAAVALVSMVLGLVFSLLSLRAANESLRDERAARAAWYDDLSRIVAFDDVRGRISPSQGRLRAMALQLVDEHPAGRGIPQAIRDIVAYGTRLRGYLRSAQAAALLEPALDGFGDVERLAAADLLQAWARPLLMAFDARVDGLGEDRGWVDDLVTAHGPTLDDQAIALAERAVALLEGVERLGPTDGRLVRARILLLDAWTERGRPEDLDRAVEHAARWLQDPGLEPDPRARDLLRTRLGGAYLKCGDLEAARRELSASVAAVVRAFPRTWYANVARAHRVELADRTSGASESGPSAAADPYASRGELGLALAETQDVPGTNHHYSWHQVRVAVGPRRVALWDWMVRILTACLHPITNDRAEEFLDELERLHASLGIEERDPITHQIARVLLQCAEAQLNVGPGARRVGVLYEQALHYLERGPETASYVPAAFTRGPLGWHYVTLGRLDDAQEVLERGAALVPTDSYVHPFLLGALGNCYSRQGRFEDGESMLVRSLEALEEWRGPTDGNVYQRLLMLVRTCRDSCRLEDAVRWHRELIERWPQLPGEQASLAWTYFQFGALDSAEQALRDAGPGSAAVPLVGRARVRLLVARGEVDEAVRVARAAVRGGDAGAHGVLARALFAARRLDEALESFAKRGWEGGVGYWVEYARALAEVRGMDAARTLLETRTDQRPRDPQAWAERARFLALDLPGLGSRDRAEAVRCAEAACACYGAHLPWVRATLAEALFRAGRVDAARATAVEVLDLMRGCDAPWLSNVEMRERARRYRGG